MTILRYVARESNTLANDLDQKSLRVFRGKSYVDVVSIERLGKRLSGLKSFVGD